MVLGSFPLDKPESRALVDTWKQRPGMLGLRFVFPPPEQSKWPTDGTIDWLWPAAERAGLPIAMMAAGFLPKVGEVAQRHPNLKLILDHLGRPSGVTSPAERWANLPEVLALAKYPNVAMKATGAPSYSDQPYPFRDIHDKLQAALRRLRPHALVLGHRHHAHALLVAPVRDACSPRSCPGSGAATSSWSWAARSATGSGGSGERMAHSRMPAVSARRASPHVAASLKPSLRGALLLRQGPRPTWEEAEACFQQALAIARQQQAKSWELRAAMSLARLWQQQGKRTEARELLAPIYGWFTEGFDTADLQEAKALLDELEG